MMAMTIDIELLLQTLFGYENDKNEIVENVDELRDNVIGLQDELRIVTEKLDEAIAEKNNTMRQLCELMTRIDYIRKDSIEKFTQEFLDLERRREEIKEKSRHGTESLSRSETIETTSSEREEKMQKMLEEVVQILDNMFPGFGQKHSVLSFRHQSQGIWLKYKRGSVRVVPCSSPSIGA